MKKIYVVATADTKGEELAFLADLVAARGQPVVRVDVGTARPATVAIDVSAAEVAVHHPQGREAVLGRGDRGRAVAAMGQAFASFIRARTDVGGIIGIGGGGGTSLITAGMRELPLGVPKIMVSTLASGDTAGFVDISDIMMLPAITDLAGLNRVSRTILHNAAEAMVGMVAHPAPPGVGRPAIGLTMFGVTTPCVMAASELLSQDYECMVFHATGAGGRTMEKLVDERIITGVLDLTTTEVCDLLFGGVLAAGPDRFAAVLRTGVPCVASLGATDMVNFWAPQTVPTRHAGRNFYPHNPNVTLMRTTAAEMEQIGHWIGERLGQAIGPMTLLIPEKGVSALDIQGGPFFDPQADQALFAAAEQAIAAHANPNCHTERLPLHINDPAFAAHAVAIFRSLMGQGGRGAASVRPEQQL